MVEWVNGRMTVADVNDTLDATGHLILANRQMPKDALLTPATASSGPTTSTSA